MSKSRRKNPFLGVIDDAKDAILSPINGLNPKKSPKYQKFTEDVMRTMLSGFERHKNPNDPKQAEIIKKWKSRLENNDFLDEIMCNEMIGELSKFIDDKEAAKKYQDAAKDSVAKVNKGIEENSKDGDEVWKWQLLQLFAIMTPLGAFSVAGHVFNYLNPLMDLFGPVLGNAGIAQGIADVATSKQLGPFGKLAELARVDDGIKIVLTKTPILKDLIEIADLITTNENVQLMGAELCPLLTASEMPLMAIAAAAVVLNLGDDLDHQKKRKSVDEQMEATLDKLRSSMPKVKPKAPNPPLAKQNQAVPQAADLKLQSPSSSPQKSPAIKKGPIDYAQIVSEPGKMIDSSDRRGGGIVAGGK
ncbi:MAG: hypothetical protein KGQ36_03020 [Rickettsiales bacterium]|nr:hypothetical protein [Rickettsiales bacterium]